MRKIIRASILFLISFSLVSLAVSATELEEIQKAIKEKGAGWIAGETSVSRLAPEQRRKLLGLLPVTQREVKANPPLSGLTYPYALDWRNRNGYNWMGAITDQGLCGNCWAHACCSAMEPVTKINLYQPTMPVNLSEMFLTWCSGTGCEGWTILDALPYIQSTGVPDEQCCPSYADECADTCNNRYLRSIFIDEWWWSNMPPIDVIKDRIMYYGPVIVGMTVYSDFYNYNSGVYTHVYGSYEALHAVVLLGWNDGDSCWIGKNSWGTDWGEAGGGEEGGWFRIAMKTSGTDIDKEIWYITVDTSFIHEIIVTNPDGGESFLAQESEGINWASPYFDGSIKIDYSLDNGSEWFNVTPGTGDDGDYTWSSVPDTSSCNCLIRVSDAVDGNPTDESDAVFHIILRGDTDKDCNLNNTDVMNLVNYLLKGWPSPDPPPDPNKLRDVNCDGLKDLSDPIHLFNYIFKGGPKPGCYGP